MNHVFADFFELAPQCCDATYYLFNGQTCASGGGCYDALHPLGSTYWFSLPYRYGWSLDVIIYAHILLILVSSILSVIAIRTLIQIKFVHRISTGLTILLWLASALIHVIFFYPVLRHSLTDTPACLFALMATWLLLITPDKNSTKALYLGVAGILLGLSAMFRIFFLFPVIGVVIIWLLVWIFNRKRQWVDLSLLSALLVIAIQYHASWKLSGNIEFLPPNPGLVEWHTNITLVGSDSALPGYQFPSYAPCDNYKSPKEALAARDIRSFACLLAGKLYFYLGSYSYATYWNPDTGDVLPEYDFGLPDSTESEGTKKINASNITQEKNKTSSQVPGQTIIRISKRDFMTDAEIYQWLELAENSKYKVSFYAWSPVNYQYITLEIRDHTTKETAFASGIFLSKTPQLFTLNKYLPMHGMKEFMLGFPYFPPSSEVDKVAKATGGEINKGYFYISNVKIENIDIQKMRHWSLLLLFINTAVFISALLFAIKYRHQLRSAQWMAYLILVLSWGEAIALVPEQRYAISIMITGWVLCLTWIVAAVFEKHSLNKKSEEHYSLT